MKPASIARISFEGIRGFLEPVTLSFANGKRKLSVCVWGDNGTGKSSFADGVEFVFDAKGVVERLGEKTTENKGGVESLANTRAVGHDLMSRAILELVDGSTNERRIVGGRPEPRAFTISELMETVPAPLVLRAADMRRFVGDTTGAKRYELFSRWVGLERLTGVLDDLTRAEGKIAALNRNEAKLEKQGDLAKVTAGKLVFWDTPAVLAWVNDEFLQGLGAELKVSAPRDLKRLETQLADRAAGDDRRTELLAWEGVASSLKALTSEDSESIRTTCKTADLELIESRRGIAAARLAQGASETKKVLEIAKTYLDKVDAASCPVCQRPFDGIVSRAIVLRQIDDVLEKLSDVSACEQRVSRAESDLRRAVRSFEARVSDALRWLAPPREDSLAPIAADLTAIRDDIVIWSANADQSHVESCQPILDRFDGGAIGVSKAITMAEGRIESLRKETSTPWAELLASVRQLREIGNRWVELDREEAELTRASEQFKQIAARIRNEITSHIQGIVDQLQDDVRAIYAALRLNDEHVPAISIVVDQSKSKSMNVEISLFGVPSLTPSGYLSDSQLNSLGLALFLASVRQFNRDFPFVVLDDIMSSYDASHRLNLIHVIRDYLGGFQVLLTTHDEPFYRQVKSVLSPTGNWTFCTLRPWRLETGVRIAGSATPDEEIEQRINDGERADVLAQLVMESVECWLQKRCASNNHSVKVHVRADGTLSDPTLADLWQAAQSGFTDVHKADPSHAIVSAHGLLNLPRHAMTGSRMTITAGEIETFWKSFKALRTLVDAPVGSTTP